MTYDVDGNGSVETLADGLLIFRYIIGYRGQTLVHSAVGAGATRTTSPVIEGYLESIKPQMDVGGDGQVEYNDALMILRYLQGFRGQVLTDGCINAGSIRNTPALIEAYIAQMVV